MTLQDQAQHEFWIATQLWRGSFEKCSAQVTACPWFRLKLASSFLFAYLSHLHPVMGDFLFLRLLIFLDSALFSCWALPPPASTLKAWRLSCLVCLSTLHRLTIPALANKAEYCFDKCHAHGPPWWGQCKPTPDQHLRRYMLLSKSIFEQSFFCLNMSRGIWPGLHILLKWAPQSSSIDHYTDFEQ